jgi:hypothetical protein
MPVWAVWVKEENYKSREKLMRRLELLIEEVREQTATQDFAVDGSTGIPDSIMVQYFNYGQMALRAIIYGSGQDQWVKTSLIDTVANQEAYSVPSDSFLGTNLLSVEYKYGSDAGDYRKLDRRSIHLRDTTYTGTPLSYVQHGNSVLINPTPSTATTDGLRITYENVLRHVDIRRGIIASTAGSPITSITLDLTPSLAKDSGLVQAGTNILNKVDFISIVDRDGVILMDDIPIDSYDTATGVITITSGFTPGASETSPVGAYIVAGAYASSVSEFPDFCEPYLVAHAKYLVRRHMGHPDTYEAKNEMERWGEAVSDTFAMMNDDIKYIHMIDRDRTL